jgi:hypothetical protein
VLLFCSEFTEVPTEPSVVAESKHSQEDEALLLKKIEKLSGHMFTVM